MLFKLFQLLQINQHFPPLAGLFIKLNPILIKFHPTYQNRIIHKA